MDNQYRQSPASAFATSARQTTTTVKYWGWCPCCGEHDDQEWVRDIWLGEVYRCKHCGREHEVKVR